MFLLIKQNTIPLNVLYKNMNLILPRILNENFTGIHAQKTFENIRLKLLQCTSKKNTWKTEEMWRIENKERKISNNSVFFTVYATFIWFTLHVSTSKGHLQVLQTHGIKIAP
jgi:hypothetical protein